MPQFMAPLSSRFNGSRAFFLLALVLVAGSILATQRVTCAANPPVASPQNAANSSLQTPKRADMIRVGLSDDSMVNQSYGSTAIGGTGAFAVLSSSGETLARFQSSDAVKFTAINGVLAVQVKSGTGGYAPLTLPQHPHSTLRVTPLDAPEKGYLKVLSLTRKGNTPRYRGDLEVIVAHHKNNQLMTVNILPMQDYLRAVVPNELPIRFGEEAVRAQAVAARNYALRPREKTWPQFDICDSQMCQAYYGQQTETPATDAMLRATEGLLLLQDGELALTLYSSSSGGVTEDYHRVFSDPKTQAFPPAPLPYLSSVWDDANSHTAYPNLQDESEVLRYLKDTQTVAAYDRKSPHFRWQRVLNLTTFAPELTKNITRVMAAPSTARWLAFTGATRTNVGKIERLEALERGVSGKLVRLRIHTSTGTITATKEFVIRSLLADNGKYLPSATIAWEPTAQGLTLYGTGFGHGVGMSQYGASGMHDAGKKFHDILTHYYPGTVLGSQPIALSNSASMQQQVQALGGHKALLHVVPALGMPMANPLILTINQRALRIPPFVGHHRVYDVTPFVEAQQLNTLTWPQLAPFTPPVTAWISFHPIR